MLNEHYPMVVDVKLGPRHTNFKLREGSFQALLGTLRAAWPGSQQLLLVYLLEV